jgi:hypothetical protein
MLDASIVCWSWCVGLGVLVVFCWSWCFVGLGVLVVFCWSWCVGLGVLVVFCWSWCFVGLGVLTHACAAGEAGPPEYRVALRRGVPRPQERSHKLPHQQNAAAGRLLRCGRRDGGQWHRLFHQGEDEPGSLSISQIIRVRTLEKGSATIGHFHQGDRIVPGRSDSIVNGSRLMRSLI